MLVGDGWNTVPVGSLIGFVALDTKGALSDVPIACGPGPSHELSSLTLERCSGWHLYLHMAELSSQTGFTGSGN